MADPKSFVGRLINNRFRLESTIGSGSFGAVYRGMDQELGGPVAVKLSLGTSVSENAFRREARLLHGIRHQHVVRVLGYGIVEELGAYYIAMEFLDGTPLERLLASGPLPTDQLAELAVQIGDALEAVHHQKTAHRDLSANNILLVKTSQPQGRTRQAHWQFVLIDFGISAKFDAQKSMGASTTKGFGTPEYMPPEMFSLPDDKELDFHMAVGVDVYAFGVILYRALTGHKPFLIKGNSLESLAHLMHDIQKVPAALPSSVCAGPRITPEIDQLILSCLAKDPSQRPGSTFEVGNQLAQLLGVVIGSGSGPLPQLPDPRPAPNWIGWVLLGLIVAAGMGLGGSYFLSPQFRAWVDLVLLSPPLVEKYQLDVSPSPIALTAGSSKEFRVRLFGTDGPLDFPAQGLRLELLSADGQELNATKGLSLALTDNSRIYRDYVLTSELNTTLSQATLKITLDEGLPEPLLLEIPIQLKIADHWKPPLPSKVEWIKVGDLIAGPPPYAKQIDLQHSQLPDPVRFHLIESHSASKQLSLFYMMENKVTRRTYEQFLTDTRRGAMPPWSLIESELDYPAVSLTINDAIEFSQWLCGPQGTLPSLEEWEMAAGAFSSDPRHFGPYSENVKDETVDGGLGPVGDARFKFDVDPESNIREMAVNGQEMTRTFQNYAGPLSEEGKLKLPLVLAAGEEYGFTIVGTRFSKKTKQRAPVNHNEREQHGPLYWEPEFADELVKDGRDDVGFRVVVVLKPEDAQACKK